LQLSTPNFLNPRFHDTDDDEHDDGYKWLNDIALHGRHIAELRNITCHMETHSINCHPTQVNVLCFNPNQTGW